MEFTPEQLDALARLGFTGAVLAGFFLLYRGIIIFRREKVASDTEKDARLAEMRNDRDAWRSVAERQQRIAEKGTDAQEATAREIRRLADQNERITTLLEVNPPGPPP